MMAPIARMLTELTDAPLKIQWSAAGTLAALNEDILEVDAIDQVCVNPLRARQHQPVS